MTHLRRGSGRLVSLAAAAALFGSLLVAAPAGAVADAPAPTPAPTDVAELPRHLSESNATERALSFTEPTVGVRSRTGGVLRTAAVTGTLEGVVYDQADEPVENVIVVVFAGDSVADPLGDELELVAIELTDAAGAWTVDVEPGDYAVFFQALERTDLAWSWASGQATPAGSFIDVTAEEITTLPMWLGEAAEIGGEYTVGPTKRPSSAGEVTLWAGAQIGEELWFSPVDFAIAEDGWWGLGQVPEGTYLVEFTSPVPQFRSEWYDNVLTFEEAELLEVTPGAWELNDVNLAQYAQVLPSALTITGTAAIGKTLTVAIPARPAGVTHTVRWFADGVYITGSTGRTSLTLTTSHARKAITVRMAATRSGYATAQSASAPTLKVSRLGTPSIYGVRAVGYTLNVDEGNWLVGTTFAYQWYANGVAISGAKSDSFTLTAAQANAAITVRVRNIAPGFTTAAPLSAATKRIPTIARPTIAGQLKVGQRLTAKPGTWTAGTAFTYQWYANSAKVAGATSSTFTVPASLAGKQLQVRVIGAKAGYETIAITSFVSAPVAR